jgi:predicted porin
MKKVLLGTTALLAAGLLSTQVSAGAVEASNLDVTLGGYGTFKIEYKSRETTVDDTLSYRSHNADFDSELEFKGSTTLDSGTSAGIEIEFETGGAEVDDSGDPIDENFIWVDGAMGKVYMGGVDAQELEESIERTYVAIGLLKVDKNLNEAAFVTSADTNGSQHNKIIWVAPAMSGIEFAINYTPELSQNSIANVRDDTVGAKGEDLLIGAKWTGAFGTTDVKVSLTYGTAKAEDPTGDKDVEDDKRQRLGFEIGMATGITIGGYWMTSMADAEDNTPSQDRSHKGIGGTWESGVWEVGVGFETGTEDEMTEADVNTKLGTDKATRMDIGVTYTLNDDMDLTVGYRTEKYEDDQNVALNENSTKSFDVKFEWDVGDGLEFDIGFQNFNYTHHDGLATSAKKTGNAGYILTKVSF